MYQTAEWHCCGHGPFRYQRTIASSCQAVFCRSLGGLSLSLSLSFTLTPSLVWLCLNLNYNPCKITFSGSSSLCTCIMRSRIDPWRAGCGCISLYICLSNLICYRPKEFCHLSFVWRFLCFVLKKRQKTLIRSRFVKVYK